MSPAQKPRPLLKQLRTELPKLLREDVEVRGQVIAVLSEYLTTREETAAILSEIRQLGQRIDEQGRRIEEQGRRIDEHTQVLREQSASLNALQRQVMGLGARWGIMNEEAFRAGVRALFADQPHVRVEQWRYRDEAGRLLGYPSDIELDAVIRDGLHVLVEIKSAVSAYDVVGFARKANPYADVTGHRPQRRLVISPYVDARAREAARQLDVEICEGVTPPTL
jgi:hypothetical protein